MPQLLCVPLGIGERAQAIEHAEQSLLLREQIEDPQTEKVRAQLAAWRKEPRHD